MHKLSLRSHMLPSFSGKCSCSARHVHHHSPSGLLQARKWRGQQARSCQTHTQERPGCEPAYCACNASGQATLSMLLCSEALSMCSGRTGLLQTCANRRTHTHARTCIIAPVLGAVVGKHRACHAHSRTPSHHKGCSVPGAPQVPSEAAVADGDLGRAVDDQAGHVVPGHIRSLQAVTAEPAATVAVDGDSASSCHLPQKQLASCRIYFV